MWQPQIEYFSPTYHCLAPDLPEHGRSGDSTIKNLEDVSQIIANLIRHKAYSKRAHVVGLSLGGSVALSLLRLAPEVVDHMLISGTSAGFGPIVAALSQLGKPLLRVLPPAPLISFGLRHSKIPQPYLKVLLDEMRYLQPQAILHLSNSLVKMELPQEVQNPVLVTYGQKEMYLTRAHKAAQQLGQIVPGQVARVPRVGHLWNLQAPKLFNLTLNAWIRDQPLPQELVMLK
jgi:pimeloyl-ACP methyl ester carboxylesterase